MDRENEVADITLAEVLQKRKEKKKGKAHVEESSRTVDSHVIASEMLQQIMMGMGKEKESETERRNASESKALKDFMANRPREFKGKNDPQEAHDWLASMEKLWRLLNIDENTKVRFATHLFEGNAESWWNLKFSQVPRDIGWKQFREVFEEKFYPESYRHQKIDEFLRLRQGENTSVNEYTDKFTELATFAPYVLPDAKAAVQKFEAGLLKSLYKSVAMYPHATIESAYEAAVIAERCDKDKLEQQEAVIGNKRKGDFEDIERDSDFSHNVLKRPFVQQCGSQGVQPRPFTPRPGVQTSSPCIHCGLHPSSETCWHRTGACYKCGSIDHRIRDCPVLQSPTNGGCYQCGSMDHRVRNCPEVQYSQSYVGAQVPQISLPRPGLYVKPFEDVGAPEPMERGEEK